MIKITAQGVQQEDEGVAFRYKIAGQSVIFPNRVKTLAGFLQQKLEPCECDLDKPLPKLTEFDEHNAKRHYVGPFMLNGRTANIVCWAKGHVFQLEINGLSFCQINLSKEHIHLFVDREFDDPEVLEVLLGPALIILLAQRRIYCLHAGAVQLPEGRVAFIAESGVGKSTLSRHKNSDWVQISDDILPIKYKSGVRIYNHFPQLKLDNVKPFNYSKKGEELDIIFRLRPDESDQLEFKRLSSPQAMLQIIRHTVAARLFNDYRMRSHARFAKKISTSIPMVELSYPRNIKELPMLQQRISEYLANKEYE